jgi:hypothetical protein
MPEALPAAFLPTRDTVLSRCALDSGGPRQAPQRAFTREDLRCHHPRPGTPYLLGCGAAEQSAPRCNRVRAWSQCLLVHACARTHGLHAGTCAAYLLHHENRAGCHHEDPVLGPLAGERQHLAMGRGVWRGVGQSTVRKQAGSTQPALTGIAAAMPWPNAREHPPSPPGAASALLSPCDLSGPHYAF